ncbi:hypothetical protein HC031_21645 [Planosporangium thailandense]|uniref:Uncharacterized protein n=1 Tax=Planosporangium thailandense TaxID=765197 RepID=A0ABX0Y1R3_9ACTN|nr:hypothetical protein [Planosporangium thailandense]NJC72299.1 hypothetical protein [Planosporangium thailandense]
MTTTQRRRTGRGEPAAQEDRAAQAGGERQHEAAGDGRHPRSAAERAARHNSSHVRLPVVGEIELPPKDELAFIGGLAVLGVLGTVEWPVVGLLAIGHALISNRRNKIMREFGEGLEQA